MIRHIRNNLKEKKGSALVSVFMVILVMLVLGMGILALTMNNVKQSAVVDNYERDYYAADRAVQLGIENLKRTVRDYYNDLALKFADTANIAAYNTAYGNFFANVRSNAAGSFIEPALDTSRGGPTSTVTTVTMGTPVGDTCIYTITSTAAAGETTRTVSQSITIIRTERFLEEFKTKFGNNPLITGGSVIYNDNNAKINVEGNATIGGTVVEPKNKSFEANNYEDGNPSSCTDSTIASKLTWTMSFPSITVPTKTTVAANVDSSNVVNLADPKYYTGSTLSVEGKNNQNFTVTGSSPATGGQIGCARNLTLNNCTLNGVTIFVSGDLTITGTNVLTGVHIYVTGTNSVVKVSGDTSKQARLTNARIYTTGSSSTVELTGVDRAHTILSNVRIYCAGNAASGSSSDLTATDAEFCQTGSGLGCQVFVNGKTKLAIDSTSASSKLLLYTGTVLTINSSLINNIIAYAGSEIAVQPDSNGERKGNRSEIMGILYSNGTIVLNSCLIRGQAVARVNIYTDNGTSSTLAELTFAPTDLSDLLNDPTFMGSIFNTSSLGSVVKTYIKPLVNEMYTGQTNIIES